MPGSQSGVRSSEFGVVSHSVRVRSSESGARSSESAVCSWQSGVWSSKSEVVKRNMFETYDLVSRYKRPDSELRIPNFELRTSGSRCSRSVIGHQNTNDPTLNSELPTPNYIFTACLASNFQPPFCFCQINKTLK